jgi:iron complex outermembrane receptor protein
MKKCISVLALSTSFGLVAQIAGAQESEQAVDDLDLVKLLNVQVSTATKTAENMDEAPAVITVVTREDIHRWGYRNIGEVLSRCVGFFSVDDHVQPNMSVRGMNGGLGAESGALKVMIDGRSVAFRTTSGNWLGAELVPLESVRQIEIIRGPASALYGADAFFGVVNIITEGPDDTRPVRARAMGGYTANNLGGQLDYVVTAKQNNVDVLVGVVGDHTSRTGLEMPSESPAPNIPGYAGDDRTANNLDRGSLGLQGRLAYRDPKWGHVIASAYHSRFTRGGDFAPWAQLTNQVDGDGTRLGTVIGLHQTRFNLDALGHVSKTLDLALQSTYFTGGILPEDRIELGSALWYARRRTSYRGVDSMAEARYFPSPRLNFVGGVEAIYDRESLLEPQRINRLNDEAVDTGQTGAQQRSFVNLGAYISANSWLIEQWLKVTAGVRYDNHNIYGGQVTGRLGATSRLSKSIVMKLLYGNAFKAPSPYLLYATPLGPGDVIGNANLEPQKIHTAEYQVSYRPSSFFGVTSGVSYNWLLNKAEFSPQGINQVARNAAQQNTLTWETRADLKHYDDYNGYVTFELLHSERTLGDVGYAADLVGDTTGVYPPYIARAGAIVGLPSPHHVPLSLGAEAMFVGPRHAADASILANGRPFSLDPYATVNAFLTTRDLYLVPGQETVIALRGYNVLGQSGPDPGFSGFEYPLSPREVYLEVRHTY